MENVRDAATQFLSNKRIAVTRVSRKQGPGIVYRAVI